MLRPCSVLAALLPLLPAATVNLAVSPNPSVFGAPASLTATITPSSSTGKVTFYDGVTILGIAKLTSGTATISTGLLPSGIRKLRAYYSGDLLNSAANSNVVTQSVSAAAGGAFLPAHSAGTRSLGIVVADFNQDGKADFAVASILLPGVDVALGNGDGTFQAPIHTDLAFNTYIAVGDFNGDGKTDLAAITDTGLGLTPNLHILLGKGDGTFQAALISPVSFFGPLAVGDFNGDGKADLAVAFGDVFISLGNGDGTFQGAANYNIGGGAAALALGDFDRNGYTDIAAINYLSNDVSILLGRGDGTFQIPLNYTVGVNPNSIVATDFDLDGNLDLAVAYSGDNRTAMPGIRVLLGNGDGTFHAASNSAVFGAAMAVGDFNGDGSPDLIVVNGDSDVQLLLGSRDGSFQPPIHFNAGGTLEYTLAVGEFNGDALADVAITDSVHGSGAVRILLGSQVGTGNFTTVQTSPPGLTIEVDGISYPGTQVFNFASGFPHTIAIPTLQSGAHGTQYVFSSWSDGGLASHSIIPNGAATTYTATFTPQYQLTTAMSPSNGGSITPVSGSFYSAGSVVSLTAVANQGFVFDSWAGAVTSPNSASTTIVMNGPQSVVAVFKSTQPPVSFSPTVTPARLTLQYFQGSSPSTLMQTLSVDANLPVGFQIGSSVSYLTTSLTSGFTPQTVGVMLNASGLVAGTYSPNLTFTFGDGTIIVVPVQVAIIGRPQLLAVPDNVNFAAVAGSSLLQAQDVLLGSKNRNVVFQATASKSSPAEGAWLLATANTTNTPSSLHIQADPKGLGPGIHQGSVLITAADAANSPLVIPVTFTVVAVPAISISAVDNAANLTPTSAAPNTLMSAFGVFPGCSSGAQVLVDGTATDMFLSSTTQINFLIPARAASVPSVFLQFVCAGLSSSRLTLPVGAVAPAIFTASRNGRGPAAVVNQDGSIGTPALTGTIVTVYGTGFGLLGLPQADGLSHLMLPVTAFFGEVLATVEYIGEAPGFTPGLQQINIRIPDDAPRGSAVPLRLMVGAQFTQEGVTVAIQ